MTKFEELKDFYKGKRVFVTGHTGFKGTWMCMALKELGAEVYGYSLNPPTVPSMFQILDLGPETVQSTIGDIRDYDSLERAYRLASPDVVFHLAAQPIVLTSYKEPRMTYETNVLGTVNILECLRRNPGAISFLNVTTDKVYENSDRPDHAFSEEERLDGYDPYSNSKSCSELVTHSYVKSFFTGDTADLPAVSTARSGNVIGGGDFADNRIIPDCVRASIEGRTIEIRNPFSTRPFQHVLEPIFAYLTIAMLHVKDRTLTGSYNIGPERKDCINTGKLADLFVKDWGEGAAWKDLSQNNAPHEAAFLMLNCTKAKEKLGWAPAWDIEKATTETVAWYKAWHEGKDMKEFTRKQIECFC